MPFMLVQKRPSGALLLPLPGKDAGGSSTYEQKASGDNKSAGISTLDS
jgi:hypothetical protein